MKKFSAVLVVMLAGAVHAASTSWALVNTEAYGGDLSPSTAKAETSYTAYFCSVAMVQTLFGGDGSIGAVTSYLKNNFATGLDKLAESATALKEGDFDLGQYTFANHNLSSALAGDYFAIITYANGEDKAARVFKNTATGGNVAFDDQPGYSGGTFGIWFSPAPEPTSGLLFLLGLAGLALRRKKYYAIMRVDGADDSTRGHGCVFRIR